MIPPPPAPPAPATALPLEFTGCAAVRRGGVCLVGEDGAALTLWVDAPEDHALELRVDGVLAPAAARAIEGGQQLRVGVPGTARALVVRDPAANAGATLALGPAPRPADLGAAGWRLLAGDVRGALGRAVPVLVAELVRLRRHFYREDRLAWARALAVGTVALAERAGLVSELGEAAQAGAFMFSRRPPRDLAAAAALLARQQPALPHFPAGRAQAPYYAGLVAYATGDLRTALRSFADSERRTRRLGLPVAAAAAVEHTIVLAQIGRADEAMARVRSATAQAAEIEACDLRAEVLTNIGWAQLQLLDAGLPAGDPVPPLAEALALSEGACAHEARADELRINLALAALAQGDPEEARPHLEALRERPLTDAAAEWRLELEARAALLEGRRRALAEPVLEPAPAERDDPELRWAGAVRRARALAAWGLREPAIAALREAEAVLDERIRALGIDEGREKFMAAKRGSVELLVDLLVDAGRVDEALCAARLARVRALRAVDRAARLAGLAPAARARWDAEVFAYQRRLERAEALRGERWQFVGPALARHLGEEQQVRGELRAALDAAYDLLGGAGTASSCAELAPPGPGELLLLVQAVPDGLVAFAADAGGTAATRLERLPAADRSALSRALLAPFAGRLAAAQRLRVLTTSALADVPVHALPWGDDVLLAAMPVVYGLDLPAAPAEVATAGAAVPEVGPPGAPAPAVVAPPGASALVIADPTGNLAHARAEADAVARELGAQGWQVRSPVAASGPAVRAALAEVELLHYAGHGRSEGLSGWDSVLVLADEGALGVADILALPRVPRVVVLSGCETGSTDGQSLAGGMNLGRAFLLAGARTVIAASGVLDDASAAAVSAELYREFAPGGRLDVPAALRRAALAIRAAQPERAAWEQLHALEP